MTDGSTTQLIEDGMHRRLRRTWPSADPWATLLIVHGLAEHSGRYDRTASLFAGSGIQVSGFDLVGHGSSDGVRCHVDEFTQYLDEVESELEASQVEGLPSVILGHSLGGLIVLDYLTSSRPHPDAAIISSPGLGGGKAWQRALAPILGRLVPRMNIPTAIDGGQLSRDPAVGEAYFGDPLVSTKTTARLGAELFAAGDRVRGNLDKLDIPTYVIHGGADEIVPPTMSTPLETHPRVKRRLYPKLRHEAMNEPEGPEVVAEMIAWLEEQFPRT